MFLEKTYGTEKVMIFTGLAVENYVLELLKILITQ